jgi:mycofactocin glycosyltransferase
VSGEAGTSGSAGRAATPGGAGRYELDAAVRRRDGGRLLVGGTPPRMVRLSEAGASALDALLTGDETGHDPDPRGRPLARRPERGRPKARPEGQGSTTDAEPGQRTTAATGRGRGRATPGAAGLAKRLVDNGLIHPLPGDGAGEPKVTTIVPVLDGGERLAALVSALAREGPVIVVDDGSRDGSAERAERAGARVLRHDSPRGPAAARNAGLAAAETELVAFLDADCEVAPDRRHREDALPHADHEAAPGRDRRQDSSLDDERDLTAVWRQGQVGRPDDGSGFVPGWRRGLAGLLVADPELALVGPRVRSAPGRSALDRYEETGSPLDLGPDASLVAPSRRIAYLPAAALVGRREALLELGGFDESMRFGEDVDLVWRLLDAGHRVRYAPSRAVLHRPRPSVAAFARQRAGYGGSAPELVRRHGSAAAPLRASRHSALIWSAALIDPRALLPALAASTAIVARRGNDRRSRAALAEVALRGQAGAVTHLARVATREWLPLSLAAATRSRRARRFLLAAALVDVLPVWNRGIRAPAAASSTADPLGPPPGSPSPAPGAGSPSPPLGHGSPADLLRATALHALDRSAYATGMWGEMARRRDFRALLPAPPP